MAAKPTVRFRRIRSRNFSPDLRCESPRSTLELFHEKEKRENACGAGERGKRRRRRGARRNEERSGTGRNGRKTVRSRALSAEREGDGGETERERRALQRRGYASLRNYASFSGPYNCVIQTLLFPIRYIRGSLAFRDASFSFFLSSPSLPLPRTFSRTSFRLSLGRGGRRGRDIRGRAKSGRAPVAQPLSTTRYR